MTNTKVTRQNSKGFALLETLIAMALFSVGILGMIALQARASQYSGNSEDRARASILANEIITQMWQKAGSSLTPSTLTSAELAAWQAAAADVTKYGLPGGVVAVSAPDALDVVTISIGWKAVSKGTAAATNSLYLTKIVIPPQ